MDELQGAIGALGAVFGAISGWLGAMHGYAVRIVDRI